jgi:hypothetical protein
LFPSQVSRLTRIRRRSLEALVATTIPNLVQPCANKAAADHPRSRPPLTVVSVFTVPENENASPAVTKLRSRYIPEASRGPLYFTKAERQEIADLVSASAQTRDCRHDNCTDCTNTEFAYHENKAMATSMAPEERQRIINNNRSLRNIKNVCATRTSALPLLTSI